MKKLSFTLFATAFALCGAAGVAMPIFADGVLANEKGSAKACTTKAPKVQKGEASWYGKANHGKKTASGEKFDANAPTAAHPTLPMGTEIEVTNLENGKETTLTVNDRGPHTKGRVLDVSKKGAEELGIVKEGTAQVKIEPKKVPTKNAEKSC
jgi:rare lipoprotein A (peptidoglycan hydrolase)